MMLGDLAVMNQSFPFIPGFDVSGVIVKAGLFCKRLKPGDEVYGLAAIRRCGAFSGGYRCLLRYQIELGLV